MAENERDQNEPAVNDVTSEDFLGLDQESAVDADRVSESEIVGETTRPAPSNGSTDPADVEDLGEETSVIDAGFAAPPVEETPPDVLSSRSPVEATQPVSETVETQTRTYGSEDDLTSTGVMRRSLFDTNAEVDETIVETPTSPQAPPAPTPAPEYDLDAALLEGATIMPEVPSRQPARWLSALAFILLTPIAWYLLSDAGGRLLIAADAPWISGTINPAAIGELIGGIALLIILAVVAMQSSLGLYISGVLFAIAGIPFLFFPVQTQSYIDGPISSFLYKLGPMGENIVFYLIFAGATGLFLTLGIGMILSGWVVTKVRRKGRVEEALRMEVVEVNPEGLKARWARKATADDS